jgi:hypothetical protein
MKVAHLEIREFEDAFMVHQPERDRVHYLNHTAVLVLELCTGAHTSSQIAEILKDTYGLDALPEREVSQIIRSMLDEGLVTVGVQKP